MCLHAAARKGHVGVVRALLSKGATVDTKTKVRLHCLILFTFCWTLCCKEEVHELNFKQLNRTRTNVFLVVTQDQYTALHIAVKHCKPQVVQILLGYGANVQHRGGKVRFFSVFRLRNEVKWTVGSPGIRRKILYLKIFQSLHRDLQHLNKYVRLREVHRIDVRCEMSLRYKVRWIKFRLQQQSVFFYCRGESDSFSLVVRRARLYLPYNSVAH